MANRYQDLLSVLPRGKFYASDGLVLPFRDLPYEFEFRTDKANRIFFVYFNAVSFGQVTTDGDGVAIVRTTSKMPPGRYDILIDDFQGSAYADTITIRHTATWMAAHAEALESMDDQLDEMDAARSIASVTPQYIEDAYGRLVRQPRPTNYLHEDYRDVLIKLRGAYRHFGGHPYGQSQAVEALTSVAPLVVPNAWRPHWVLGTQLADNGDFQTRARLSEAMFGPPGASGPVAELANINRQSRYFVHPAVTGTVTTGFRSLPKNQKLTVTIADANRMTLVGLDERGEVFSEVVPDPAIAAAAGTYETQTVVSSLTSATKSAGAAGQIGLSDERFLHVTGLSSLNQQTSTSLRYFGYASGGPRFGWGSGNGVRTEEQDSVTLKDIGRTAHLIGRVEVANGGAEFNLDPTLAGNVEEFHDRLYLEVDDRGIIWDPSGHPGVDIGAGTNVVSIDDAVILINAAFAADPKYGVSYNTTASELIGTEGDNYRVLMLESPDSFIPNIQKSRIKLHPGPRDAALQVFGLPRTTTRLVSAIAGTSVSCLNTSRLPAVSSTDPSPYRRRFDVRIRGIRQLLDAGTLNRLANPSPAKTSYILLNTYIFSSTDIGGYIYWTDFVTGTNAGLHKIIDIYDSGLDVYAVVQHELASTVAGEFTIAPVPGFTTGQAAVYHPGEIVTIIDNDTGTNVLTVDAAPSWNWPEGALVELVDDTPYVSDATDGLGEIGIDVDATYRPYHDFGDSLTNVGGTTMRLSCARGLFTGQVGQTITFQGCDNTANDGDFALIAVTPTTADFTNAAGVNETSEFEWFINNPATTTSDTVTVEGTDLPDGWVLDTAATTIITIGNVGSISQTTTPGLLVPSRIALSDTVDIVLWKNFPSALDYRGLQLEASFWVQEHTADATTFLVEVSFDDGANFHEVASTMLNATILRLATMRGPQDPSNLTGSFFVPWDAETCILRLTRTPAAPAYGTFTFEKMTLRSLTGTGLVVGDNTVPRSQKRAKFGKLLYIWSADPLSDEEKGFIGLSDSSSIPSAPGHVDFASSAHLYWDRIDLSEYDDSTIPTTRLNLRGVYGGTEWADVQTAGGLTYLTTVIGTPDKLSRLVPVIASTTTDESLTMVDGGDGPGTARANLALTSNHEGAFPQDPNTGTGSGARLYEVRDTDTTFMNPDGLLAVIPAGTLIPVPDTLDSDGVQPWEFMSATQIRVNAPYFNSTSSYVFDYDLLMRAETGAIELAAVGVDVSEYVWLADLVLYRRHNVNELTTTRTEEMVFKTNYEASLKEQADTSENASLLVNDGMTEREVPFTLWRFQDARTIVLDSTEFNPDATYSLTYVARVPRVTSDVTARLEWRSATTEVGLVGAGWVEVSVNQPLSPEYAPGDNVTMNAPRAWHQFRVTLGGVSDIRDVSVYGIGIKGIHLWGSGANAPGLLTPAP